MCRETMPHQKMNSSDDTIIVRLLGASASCATRLDAPFCSCAECCRMRISETLTSPLHSNNGCIDDGTVVAAAKKHGDELFLRLRALQQHGSKHSQQQQQQQQQASTCATEQISKLATSRNRITRSSRPCGGATTVVHWDATASGADTMRNTGFGSLPHPYE